MSRSADSSLPPLQLRRLQGVDVHAPDVPRHERTWGVRTDDHWYAASCTIIQLGMAEPQRWMRFDFRGDGELDPDNARAGINMRIGRAGLRAVAVVLVEITMLAYDQLAAEEGS